MRESKRRSVNPGIFPIYLFLTVWALSELFVLVWVGYSSFKSTTQVYRDIWSLPTHFNTTGYYLDLTGQGVQQVPLGHFLVNSSIVAFSSVVGIILISVPAGYALSKKSRTSTTVFYLLLAMIAIPPPALLIPELFLMKTFGFLNTPIGLILPYISFNIPFSIVLARAFFRVFPTELEEAAQIDGLGDFGIFRRIVLPLSGMIVVVLAIINFPNVWNELLYALVIVPATPAKTAQPGLLLFQSFFKAEWNAIFSGLVLVSLPMIIFYIIFQRYIVKAAFIGAIKG